MKNKKEIIYLYDINRNFLNKTIERNSNYEILLDKEFCLVTNIWTIQKSTKKILLTKRAYHKKYGGFYECTAGWCIESENTLNAAIRELKEETNLNLNKETIQLINTTTFNEYIVDTYIHILDFDINDIKLDPNETIEYVLVTYDELIKMLNNNKIAPSICKRMIFYTKKIYNIIKCLNEGEI